MRVLEVPAQGLPSLLLEGVFNFGLVLKAPSPLRGMDPSQRIRASFIRE